MHKQALVHIFIMTCNASSFTQPGRCGSSCQLLRRPAEFGLGLNCVGMASSNEPREKSQLLVRWRAWSKPHQQWRSIWFFGDVARVADNSAHAKSLLKSSEGPGIAERLAELGKISTPVHLLRYRKDDESWWTNLRSVSLALCCAMLSDSKIVLPHLLQIVYYTRGQGSISAISSDGTLVQGKRAQFSDFIQPGDFVWFGKLPPVTDAIKVCELCGF